MDEKASIDESLSRLSIPQKAFVAITLLWLAFSLARETISFVSSPLLRVDGFILYIFAIPLTFIGTVLPLLLIIWLCWKISRHLQHNDARRSIYKAIRAELDGSVGIALFIFVLTSPIYLLIEDFMSFSVLPLTTPGCGVLGAIVGYWVFKSLAVKNRLTLLCLLLCLVLATEYLDWNPRKSLLRDMYRVRRGMTVAEVERIMDGHIKGYNQPENLARDFGGEGLIVYIGGTGGSYNADIGEITILDGKVEGVEFSHD